MNILPNFLIVGASKSGTSSVYHYLRQHPEIFLSEKQKEGRFFSQMQNCFEGPGDSGVEKTITKDLVSYQKLFESHSEEKAVGDISPEYLYFHKDAIPLIKETLGEKVKIIIILRNPVDRAFSAYTHFVRDKRETLLFEEALKKEEERDRLNWLWAWQYASSGFYFDQVKAYIDNFKNVQIIRYDDLLNDSAKTVTQICEFLEVSSDFEFDTSYKYNVSGEPKSQVLYKLETSRKLVSFFKMFVPRSFVTRLKKRWTGEKQMIKSEMNPETRAELINYFKDDILKVQDLIQQDLLSWMK